MNYQNLWQYIKEHKGSLILTSSFASVGTLLTLYGLASENIAFILWGPVIALLGKILFAFSLFGPKLGELISSKLR